jgi:single-strand DNA-binding protein
MSSYNRVVLVGGITRDPEVKYLQSGTAVCELGIAINEREKKANVWHDVVTYVDVTLWDKTAETAGKYLTKGSSVLIEGRLKLDTWEKDGKKNYKLRVIGERMQMLGGKPGKGRDRDASEEPVPTKPSRPQTNDAPRQAEEDIPF